MDFSYKIWTEIEVSEIWLAKKDKKYVFPRKYYEPQIKDLKLQWHKSNLINRKNIINNKDKITFRKKSFVSLGYHKDYIEAKSIYLLITTSLKKNNRNQFKFYVNKKGKTIYINLDKMYTYELKNNDDTIFSDITDKYVKKYIHNEWGKELTKRLDLDKLKELSNNTGLIIYKYILKNRNKK